jgi:hypothetical protein
MAPVSADTPVAGFYKSRMVRGGPWVPIRIWLAPSTDPVTGEELDRSPTWHAERLGREIDVDLVWPYCAAHPIEESEYRFLLADHKWAVEHDPDAPQASPRSPIDHMKTKPIF